MLTGSIFGDHAWTRPASLNENQVPLFDGVPDWLAVYPDQFPAKQAKPWLLQFLAYVPDSSTVGVAWLPVYPNQFPRDRARPWLQFLALSPQITVYTGNQAVPIHVPDEVPPDVELRISVEHDVGGGPVAFDVPPDVRVYYLNALGVQVDVLVYTLTTQYGVNPAYYVDWTPTLIGKFIVEVLGVYLGLDVVGVVPITVRPKFDPIAIALTGDFVARNGDV